MTDIHPINTLAAKPSQQSPSSTQVKEGCTLEQEDMFYQSCQLQMFLLLAKSWLCLLTGP